MARIACSVSQQSGLRPSLRRRRRNAPIAVATTALLSFTSTLVYPQAQSRFCQAPREKFNAVSAKRTRPIRICGKPTRKARTVQSANRRETCLASQRSRPAIEEPRRCPASGDHALFSIMTTEPNGIVEPIHGKAMPVMLMTPDDVNSAGTADLLQATHQGPALREQLHRPQREVQATARVRMLTRLCPGGGARNGNRDACWGGCGNICWGKAERDRHRGERVLVEHASHCKASSGHAKTYYYWHDLTSGLTDFPASIGYNSSVSRPGCLQC